MSNIMRPLINEDLKVIFTVMFYMFSSISMVMLNKYVLNSNDTPLFLLWGQLVIAIILMHVMSWFKILQLPRIAMKESKQLLPLILVNAFGLSANTFCLQYVDASLYQVARSLTLPFTVFLSIIYLNEKISPMIIISCLVIFAGFLSGTTLDKLDFDSKGFFYGVLSSFTTALHSIVIKNSLEYALNLTVGF